MPWLLTSPCHQRPWLDRMPSLGQALLLAGGGGAEGTQQNARACYTGYGHGILTKAEWTRPCRPKPGKMSTSWQNTKQNKTKTVNQTNIYVFRREKLNRYENKQHVGGLSLSVTDGGCYIRDRALIMVAILIPYSEQFPEIAGGPDFIWVRFCGCGVTRIDHCSVTASLLPH